MFDRREPRICHNLLHVRALPTFAAEATRRGILRHRRLARRLESALQHCADSARPGDPPAPRGASPAAFADEVGTRSIMGERCFWGGENDQRKVGNGWHETSVPRCAEISQVPHSGRWLLRMATAWLGEAVGAGLLAMMATVSLWSMMRGSRGH
jgi:hypothetical protein